MKCIYCFLSDYFQNEIKKKAQNGENRFENTLDKYKSLFLKEITYTVDVEHCECRHQFNDLANQLINDLRKDLYNKISYIESLFDEVIEVYCEFIQTNHIKAYNRLVRYIEKYTSYSISNSHDFCKPLFRVRPKQSELNPYDQFNENEYFHIPFSKRHLVGNQRYSISGLPMCYLADSLQTALNEVEKNIDDVNVSLFMPRYSDFYWKGIFDATNILFENLRVSINMILFNQSVFKYDDKFDWCLKRNIDKLLAEFVLYQVLQYPVNCDNRGTFIAEYVLPQLLLEEVQKNERWVGVKYQSTKSIRNNTDISELRTNENYCFVVPYDANNDYSMTFKSRFFIALATKARKAHIEELRKELKSYKLICDENDNNGYIMDEYRMYAARVSLFMEQEETAYHNKMLDYQVYQTEINLLFYLILELETLILNPEKNSIVKRKDNM